MKKNWILWIPLFILLIWGCNTISPKKFTLYKAPPFTAVRVMPKLDGYYYFKSDSTDCLIFLFANGTCYINLNDYYHSSPSPARTSPDSIAKYRIDYFNSMSSDEFAIWESWGHYSIKDDKIFFEYYHHTPQRYKWNILSSQGKLLDLQTFGINELKCDANNPACKNIGHKAFYPPLEFKFHRYDLSDLDNINPYFTKKGWYQKNVWYNQELHSQ
ncbi:MAG: hypothetical protein JKY52_03190 [Flavobacteriales bacterium]|nr:hypothetical protein [Flavobacteriales bacterium]